MEALQAGRAAIPGPTTITERLAALISRTNMLTTRAGLVGNQLFGQEPEDDKPERGVSDTIEEQVVEIDRSLDLLEHEIIRLEQI